MDEAAIAYRGEELRAWEDEAGWTVRLGELEACSRYLDLALAALLDAGDDVHQLAARLLAECTSKGPTETDAPVAAQPERTEGPGVTQLLTVEPTREERYSHALRLLELN
jgi:hypothetical protein